jgi:hypothetical protein
MAMAQNFIEGHGFSFKYLNTQGEIYYRTHIQWPPLYPFILALITIITSNALISSLIIQIAVMVLLLFIWKKIFNLFREFMSEDAYFYFIALLIISTSILNNINTVLVFTLLLLSLSIYFIFAYLLQTESKILNFVLSALFASLLFWTHYSYFFVAFYPAVVLLIIYYIHKEKTHLVAGLSSFVISLIITSGVLIYNFISTGFINYMDNPSIWNAGFFPQHLLLTDPFFLNAFFKSAYILEYLFAKNLHLLINIIFQLISFAILVTILILYLKLRKTKTHSPDRITIVLIPFFAVIILTISFLLYFTLRYHEIPRPDWTHIGDARYLSPVYLSILAVVILLLFVKVDYLNKNILKFIRTVLILLIITNSLINILITFKELGNYSYRKDTYIVPGKELQSLFTNIKLEISKGNLPVFVDNELTERSVRVSQYAGAAVIDEKDIINLERFPSNLVFFIIMPNEKYYDKEDWQFKDWAEKYTLRNIGNVYKDITLFRINNSSYE